jgi:hypothetical protein
VERIVRGARRLEKEGIVLGRVGPHRWKRSVVLLELIVGRSADRVGCGTLEVVDRCTERPERIRLSISS